MAGMGGNYYAALGMSVAENTGAKELESASQGLSSALAGQVANQAILTQANNDLYSIFDNTNKLVKDIQTDQIREQQLEEDKKSKDIMINEAMDKSNEATMNILTGYENYLKEGANNTLKEEITQNITGNKDISVTTNAIDNVIDNLNLKNAMFKDPITSKSIPIGEKALDGFDKEAIRRYVLAPDRLFADYKNGFVTDKQYGAISFLINNGGIANAIRREDEAKRTLKDVNDGIKTPAMYQREAQILKETNPFFYRDIETNDLAMALSKSQDIMTGKFNGKSYTSQEEFDKTRRLAEYDKSNIGQVAVKGDNKDNQYVTKEDIIELFKQYSNNKSPSSESKTLDKALDTNNKNENNMKIDINTGEILPEYKQDAVKQQQEINTQATQTKNIANNMNNDSKQLDIKEQEAKKALEEGKITKDEYESIVYTQEQGKKDTLNALSNSSITSKMYDDVMKSKTMKDIQEYVEFNNKGYKDIFMDDNGNISKKHQDLLDSINIDELRQIGKQLIGAKELLEREIEQETNPNIKIAYQNRLKEINNNLELVNSIGKTKSKMNAFDNDFNHTTVATNDAKQQYANAEKEYKNAIETEREWIQNKTKVSSAELDKNENTKKSALNSTNRINTLALGSTVGIPAKAVKEDGAVEEKYTPIVELSKQGYKFATGNDIKKIDGTTEEINITNESRAMNGVKSTLAIVLDPDSYNSAIKYFESAKDNEVAEIWQEIKHYAHQYEINLGTGAGLENAAFFSSNTAKDYIDKIQTRVIKLIRICNKNDENGNIILKTKSDNTLSSEMKDAKDERTFRETIEFFARQGTKEENGRLLLDKKDMTALEYNENNQRFFKSKRRESNLGEKIASALLNVG